MHYHTSPCSVSSVCYRDSAGVKHIFNCCYWLFSLSHKSFYHRGSRHSTFNGVFLSTLELQGLSAIQPFLRAELRASLTQFGTNWEVLLSFPPSLALQRAPWVGFGAYVGFLDRVFVGGTAVPPGCFPHHLHVFSEALKIPSLPLPFDVFLKNPCNSFLNSFMLSVSTIPHVSKFGFSFEFSTFPISGMQPFPCG